LLYIVVTKLTKYQLKIIKSNMSNSNPTKHPVHDEVDLYSQDGSQPEQDLQAGEIVEHQPPPGKQRRWPWILGLVLVLGGLGLGWLWLRSSSASKAPAGGAPGAAGQPPGVSVKLATVATSTVQDSTVFIGTLESPRFVTVRPQVEGRIVQILAKEGDRVQQGQPIISLQSDDAQALLQQRQAALQQANANLALLKAGTRPEQIAQARATLAQAQSKLTDARSGSELEAIAQAEAQIGSAQSAIELARSRATRYAFLAKQGAVSQDSYAGYVNEQRNAAAALVVAQRRLDQLRQTRTADINSFSATVNQQQQNLQQQLNGSRPQEIAQAQAQVSQAAAQVKSAQVQLKYAKVLAPFTGTVGDIPLKVGDYAAKGDALTTLTKNDSFDLNLSIPFARARQLRTGTSVELLDATGKSVEMGKVGFIAPNATADSQTILAKANFANSSGRLLNRQSVQARVIWDKRLGISIPVTAVSRLGGKTFVFVAEAGKQSPDGKSSLVARQQPVDLEAIEGTNYQVTKGLRPGEKIVTSGLLNLTNGVPIVVAPKDDNAQKSP
jgi:RND family efflux transporter MFP subunit